MNRNFLREGLAIASWEGVGAGRGILESEPLVKTGGKIEIGGGRLSTLHLVT